MLKLNLPLPLVNSSFCSGNAVVDADRADRQIEADADADVAVHIAAAEVVGARH